MAYQWIVKMLDTETNTLKCALFSSGKEAGDYQMSNNNLKLVYSVGGPNLYPDMPYGAKWDEKYIDENNYSAMQSDYEMKRMEKWENYLD